VVGSTELTRGWGRLAPTGCSAVNRAGALTSGSWRTMTWVASVASHGQGMARAEELVTLGREAVGGSSGERHGGARSREQRRCDVEQSTVLPS
jgi:hypothetical protein